MWNSWSLEQSGPDADPPMLGVLTTDYPILGTPNHKMVLVTVQAGFSDASGPTFSRIVSVARNEPEEGTGDGDTSPDIEITGNLTVNLRSERSQKGAGRTYTIVVETVDSFGNARRDIAYVIVPK